VALCRRFPGLTAEVLDLPASIEHARAMVREEGMEGRVTFREGDLRQVDWGQGYDVVLLCNILHNLAADECAEALRKARAALREGGTVVVADSAHSGSEGDLEATAGFNELFFFLVSGSQAWPEPMLREWLDGAGFVGVRRRSTMLLPGLVVLAATAGGRHRPAQAGTPSPSPQPHEPGS
jgi:SAM-dependent methyltransferase